MNILQIAGHLGADPETRFTPSGQKVTTLRVAVNTRRSGKEETMWWQVTLWGDAFDKMLPYLKKGSAIIVVGEMSKPEIYTDKEGRPQASLRMTAEFIRFSPFGKPERTGQEQHSHAHSPQHPQATQQSGFGDNNFMSPIPGTMAGGYASGNSQSNFEEEQMPF